ncbi:hypothetical protein Ddye_027203 [Dipteronia dyeriana]|uniref:Uncharacterized protein n=1 Tax=Dipteronia dyeriana TaxID=168575 RepID=A0AAD9WR58_9ROSI|nr:hypothetical protein Ddye_027203 [Dipteronia dyeriana]
MLPVDNDNDFKTTPDLRCPPTLSRRRRQITPSIVGVNSARLSPSPQYRHRRQLSCTFSSIGFNVETVQYNNIKFQVWDLVIV